MIEVSPGPSPPRGSFRVPGSKYEANRFLVAAALTEGASRIIGAPDNEDIRAAVAALPALGARAGRNGDVVEVSGSPEGEGSVGSPPLRTVAVGASGTLLRFLTAASATTPAPVRLDGNGRIRERPIRGLVGALEALGARIETSDGYAPLTVRSGTLRGGMVRVPSGESSQFASALLLAAPRAAGALTLELEDEPVSASYLDLTVRTLARCGVRIERPTTRRFSVAADQRYRPGEHRVSGDWTTAGYFFAAAALTGGAVSVTNLDPDSPQGERHFPALLGRLGCEVREDPAPDGVRVSVRGARRLRGITSDFRAMPDAAPTLAALAPFAEGPTVLRGIRHLRHKESDRIEALAEGLSRLGARVRVASDSLEIMPPPSETPLRGAPLDPRGDHRIAMAFGLAGLRVPGVRIRTPEVVGKSFPGFWDALAQLGARISSGS